MKILIFFVFLFLISFASAAVNVGVTNNDIEGVQITQPSANFSTTLVNFSEFTEIWLTDEGPMDNVPDLYPTLDTRYCELGGCTMTGDLIIDSGVEIVGTTLLDLYTSTGKNFALRIDDDGSSLTLSALGTGDIILPSDDLTVPNINLEGNIVHEGDTNTVIQASADQWNFVTGASTRFTINNDGVKASGNINISSGFNYSAPTGSFYCDNSGCFSLAEMVKNNTEGWTVNFTKSRIEYLNAIYASNQGNFKYNIYDDGSELFFNFTEVMDAVNFEMDNSKLVLFNEPTSANDFKVFQIFSKQAQDVSEFVVTKAGTAHASYFVRSLGIVGNATSTPTPFNCTTYSRYLDCRTDETGADFFVRDDVEVNGTLYVLGDINLSQGQFLGDGSQLTGVGFDASNVAFVNNSNVFALNQTINANLTLSDRLRFNTGGIRNEYIHSNTFGSISMGSDDSNRNNTIEFLFEAGLNNIDIDSNVATLRFLSGLAMGDDKQFGFGSQVNAQFVYDTGTIESLELATNGGGIGGSSGYISILNRAHIGLANREPDANLPSQEIALQLWTGTSQDNDWWYFQHNDTNPVINWNCQDESTCRAYFGNGTVIDQIGNIETTGNVSIGGNITLFDSAGTSYSCGVTETGVFVCG